MLPWIGFIPSYGLMAVVGAFLGLLFLRYFGLKAGQTRKDCRKLEILCLCAAVVAFLSAALFESIYEWIEHPDQGFPWFTGLTFFGGLIGACVFFVIAYKIIYKSDFGPFRLFLTYVPISLTLAHGCGRIGCFLAGCCYGKETSSFLGVKFPSLPNPVYPTQLYEAIFLFLCSAAFAIMFLKGLGKWNAAVYCLSYGAFRFGIEFLRGDDRGSLIPGISPSQFWAIVLFLIGIFLLVWVSKKKTEAEAAGQ